MVCIPCIIVPAALWLYCKFLQPLILRWLPPTWRLWVDSWLYPTCPVKPPPTATAVTADSGKIDQQSADDMDVRNRKVASGVDVSGKETEEQYDNGAGIGRDTPMEALERNGLVVGGDTGEKVD